MVFLFSVLIPLLSTPFDQGGTLCILLHCMRIVHREGRRGSSGSLCNVEQVPMSKLIHVTRWLSVILPFICACPIPTTIKNDRHPSIDLHYCTPFNRVTALWQDNFTGTLITRIIETLQYWSFELVFKYTRSEKSKNWNVLLIQNVQLQ